MFLSKINLKPFSNFLVFCGSGMICVEYIAVVCGLGYQWRMRVLLVLCPALLAAISIVQGGASIPLFLLIFVYVIQGVFSSFQIT